MKAQRIQLTLLAATLMGASMGAAAQNSVADDVNYTQDVIYQIMTDRFHDGDASNNPSGALFSANCTELRKYCGGDFAGIVQQIQNGYLTDLGITALWISQPVENVFTIDPGSNATSYHGFWARDYKRTNPFFGDMADFENLIDVAHANGIKVIIDFTPNHTSPSRDNDPSFMENGVLYDNGSFVGSVANDPLDIFHTNGGTDFSTYEDGMYRNLFDLADYNLQSPTIDGYLKDSIQLWMDKGIDGLRVDAVKHFPAGWAKNWVDSIYAHRPIFTFGEWFLGNGEIDPLNHDFANESGMSLLDFRYGQTIRNVLRDNTGDWLDFDAMIQGTAADYDEVIDQVAFIDNHDMPRFHFNGADTRRTDMALAVTLTSRGVPIVYYGTEQYMTGNTDPTNRQFMTSFNRTTRAYQVIQALAPLRQSNPALAYGDTQERWINSNIYIYERQFGDHVVLVAINKATSGSTTINGLFTDLPAGSYSDELNGLLNGNSISVASNGAVTPFALGAGEVGVWEFTTSSASAPRIGHVGTMTARPNQQIAIAGEGFGNNPGSVRFNGIAAPIDSWSGNRIIARVPSIAAGFYNVSVRTSGGVNSNNYPRFEVLTGKQISVRFIVNNAFTFMGQDVYLTGSVHELSQWSTGVNSAIGPFFNQIIKQYPSWYYDVSLPAGTTVQFKFIKVDSVGNVTWEGGNNHVYTVPASGTGTVEVNWQN
ncbi:MAG: alpha-amylase AmyA [Wenzhouxiangellaceae bacterium]